MLETHRKSITAAFESRMRQDPNGCWQWLGNRLKRGGYGAFTMRRAGLFMVRAHRLAWMLFRGPIQPTDHVLHRCDNQLCVNPDHLFLGDQPINMEDMVQKSRQTRGEEHPDAKLSDNDVRYIRSSALSASVLATQLNVSWRTIYDVRSRKTWKHLT